ncbi:MAG: hypothetical protein AB7G11_07730 [Phycisphaerales bacterium]
MNTPLVIMSVLVIAVSYATILNDLRTGRREFLSWKTIFLLGFAQFYGFGTYFTITDNFGSDIYIAGDKGKLLLLLCLPLFIVLFYVALRLGEKWCNPLRRVLPPAGLPITDPGIVITTAALLGCAIVAAVVPMGSYLTVLISQFRGGLSGAAAGLATYYLIARRFNPIAWAIFLATFAMCFLIGMVGETGRRGILGVLLAVCWVWWYFSLKQKPLASKLVRLGSIAALTFMLVAFYASFRGEGGTTSRGGGGYTLALRVQQISDFLKNPMLQRGAIKTMMASDAPTDTMFIMENYPESYEYDPFNGLVYFLVNPIPRFLWQNKPIGMGVVVQQQLNTPANLGIGILGHGWSEGGWLGVAGYAIFFGLLIGALDRVLHERSWNPYFVVAIGCNLGNVFGLARGETSLFLVLVVSSIVGVLAVMYVVKMIFGPVMLSGAPLLTAGNRWIIDAPADDEYSEPDAYSADEHFDAAVARDYERGTAPFEYRPSTDAQRVREAG